MKKLVVLLGVAGALALGLWQNHAVSAQRGRDPRGRGGRGRPAPPSALLESVTSLTCEFPSSTVATWEGGEPQAQLKNGTAAFTLAITDIDVQDGTAQIAGAPAGGEVTVKLAGSNLHVLETRPDGALTITTVFARESRDGRLEAVHSRFPDVSQYYGNCEIRRRQPPVSR